METLKYSLRLPLVQACGQLEETPLKAWGNSACARIVFIPNKYDSLGKSVQKGSALVVENMKGGLRTVLVLPEEC